MDGAGEGQDSGTPPMEQRDLLVLVVPAGRQVGCQQGDTTRL